jgi:hypothetical protein
VARGVLSSAAVTPLVTGFEIPSEKAWPAGVQTCQWRDVNEMNNVSTDSDREEDPEPRFVTKGDGR